MASEWTRELKKGSIQLCLLAMLSREPKYGFQIIKELRRRSQGYYDLAEGTLYPALHRLQKRGLLSSQRMVQEDRPPRKYYTLTPAGRQALSEARAEWNKMTRACNTVLASALDEGGAGGAGGASGAGGEGNVGGGGPVSGENPREVDENG